MLNKLSIIGRITREPILKTVNTRNGEQHVVNLNVAVNEYIQGSERTTYYSLAVWGSSANYVDRNVTIGTIVYVSGRPSISQYIDSNNNHKASITITVRDINVISGWKRNTGSSTNYQRVEQPTKRVEMVDLDSVEISGSNINKAFTMADQVVNDVTKAQSQVASSGINKYHQDNETNNDTSNLNSSNFEVRNNVINNLKNNEDDYE